MEVKLYKQSMSNSIIKKALVITIHYLILYWAFHLIHMHLGGQVSYTFPLRITCKKGGGDGVQITCKIVFILIGRPQSKYITYH